MQAQRGMAGVAATSPTQPPSSIALTLGAGQSAAHTVALRPSPRQQLVSWRCSARAYDVLLGVALRFPARALPCEIFPARRVASSGDCSFLLPPSMSPASLDFSVGNAFSLLRSKQVDFVVEQCDAEAAPAAAVLRASALLDERDALAVNLEATAGLALFFTNRFDDAEACFLREKDRVAVFALSYATMAWLRALMGMDEAAQAEARARLVAAQAVAAAVAVQQPQGAPQLEASVVGAELILLQGVLSLLDESVMGLLNCALHVRSAFLLYEKVNAQVEVLEPGPRISPTVKCADDASPALMAGFDVINIAAGHAGGRTTSLAFVRSGLQFGLGTFNLVVSTLPPLILHLLSWAGFPSDRALGMACLRDCLRGGGVRFPLAAMNLLAMRVLMPSFHSGADVEREHAPEAAAVLEGTLERLPDSALFLWFNGRLQRSVADFDGAARSFERCSAAARDGLPPLAQLAEYDSAILALFRGDFGALLALTGALQRDNRWSPATYSFLQALALRELGRPRAARAKFVETLRLTPKRLAGRVVAAEQWAGRHAAAFVALTTSGESEVEDDGDSGLVRVPLPEVAEAGDEASLQLDAYPVPLLALEATYFWAGFTQIGPLALKAAVSRVDRALVMIAGGRVFDRAQWGTAQAAAGAAARPSLSGSGSSFDGGGVKPVSSGTVSAQLEAAARAPVRGFSPAGTVAASAFASHGGPASAPSPFEAAATAALVRGAACLALGHVDESAEALDWAVARGAGPFGRRSLHLYAYALYELGTLYLCASRALSGGAAGAEALRERGFACSRLVLEGGLTAAQARVRAQALFAKAGGIGPDFPWKVRLAVRLHLAADDGAFGQ